MYFLFQHGTITLGDPSSQPYLHNLVENAVFPYELTHPGHYCISINECGVTHNPAGYAPTWETVLLAMFMHGGLLHLGGNMLFLWIFGNNVEDAMGPVRFILFYLLGGIAATALQVAIDPNATVPSIGASGAIAGVLGGNFVLYPRAKVLSLLTFFFFLPIRLPAWLVLGSWFVLQYISLRANAAGSGAGVAYLAHVIGFVLGAALCWPLRRSRVAYAR
jgi:membrane associated rhomboid family serine protease